MERPSNFLKKFQTGLGRIILITSAALHPVDNQAQQIQQVTVICTTPDNPINLEPHANIGYFGVVEGSTATGSSVLTQYLTPYQLISIPVNDRSIQHMSLSTRYIYNPGDGVRITSINIPERYVTSIFDIKENLPYACFSPLFRNAERLQVIA